MATPGPGSRQGYIDIHFHILPGVDDGAKDVEMALELARLAVEDGTTLVVATPHPDARTGIGSHSVTVQAVANFNAVLSEHGISGLRVVPGVECYLVPEILQLLKRGELFPLNNSRYVLVEFHHLVAPVNIEQVVFRLRTEGYVPVIAHPERYRYVQEDLKWVARLVQLGCLTQVTAGAYYGRFGKRCQKAAEDLLRYNLTQVIASDAHNLKLRAPGLSPARPTIERIAGPGRFEQLAVGTPAKILDNLPCEPESPELLSGKPFWKFW
jgi:protein-tyrosine phosphatase